MGVKISLPSKHFTSLMIISRWYLATYHLDDLRKRTGFRRVCKRNPHLRVNFAQWRFKSSYSLLTSAEAPPPLTSPWFGSLLALVWASLLQFRLWQHCLKSSKPWDCCHTLENQPVCFSGKLLIARWERRADFRSVAAKNNLIIPGLPNWGSWPGSVGHILVTFTAPNKVQKSLATHICSVERTDRMHKALGYSGHCY